MRSVAKVKSTPIMTEHVVFLNSIVLMNRSYIRNQKTCHFPDWVLQMVDGSQTLQNINAPQQCFKLQAYNWCFLPDNKPSMRERYHQAPPIAAGYATYAAFAMAAIGNDQKKKNRNSVWKKCGGDTRLDERTSRRGVLLPALSITHTVIRAPFRCVTANSF